MVLEACLKAIIVVAVFLCCYGLAAYIERDEK